jgi:hypothetical protein
MAIIGQGWKAGGSAAYNVRTETGATYLIVVTDDHIRADCTAQSQVISLPSSASEGDRYTVKRIDSSGNTVTVDTNDAATIDGLTDITLLSKESATFVYVSADTTWDIQ